MQCILINKRNWSTFLNRKNLELNRVLRSNPGQTERNKPQQAVANLQLKKQTKEVEIS